ncbi:MAG: DUF4292 domain-containing protein, partial [Verrucomicrobiae bacterium]|nr:DUF4292 domain-containing protein [Verrucomicrobiae bacterium]
LLYAVSDGAGLGVFDVRNNTFYSTKDAERLLREATGGAAGLDDLVSLMIGRLPFEDAEVTEVREIDGMSVFTFAGPEGTRAEVTLDPRTLTTRKVEAFDHLGQRVLTADYTDYLRVGGSRLPEEVRVEVPQIELKVSLEFNSWNELGRIPDSFTLPQPGGSTYVDLNAWVDKARESVVGETPAEETPAPDSPEPAVEPEPAPEPEVVPEAEAEAAPAP